MRYLLAALALFTAVSLAGCDAGMNYIDGIPIGDPVPAGSQYESFALQTLDAAEPGHAAVKSIELYTIDRRDDYGNNLLVGRSGGGSMVVVLRLVDATTRAFYIGCGVGIDVERCFAGGASEH